MGINLNFGVGNIKNAPGIISDIAINQPSAASVADGTIFIDRTNLNIQTAISGVWVTVSDTGGGGGGGIDSVLAINQAFTNNRIIDQQNFAFQIRDGGGNNYWLSQPNLTRVWNNNSYLDFQANTIKTFFSSGNTGLYFDNNTQLLQYGNIDNSNGNIGYIEVDYVKGQFTTIINHGSGSVNFGFYSSFINGSVFVGDKTNNFGLNVDVTNQQSNFVGGGSGREPMKFDFLIDQFDFGEVSVFQNFIRFTSGNIATFIGGSGGSGLDIDATTGVSQFGNWTGGIGIDKSYMKFDPTNSELTIGTEKLMLTDNRTGNLISGTASGASGDHLVIKIDGKDYKIQLLNP